MDLDLGPSNFSATKPLLLKHALHVAEQLPCLALFSVTTINKAIATVSVLTITW